MIRRFFISLIHFYQKFLSGLKPYPTCKYIPTCSCYACEAIKKNGIIIGSLLSIWRILRCNPFSNGGYDPVPDFRRNIK